MDKPSVTIKHTEAYALGGGMLVFALMIAIAMISKANDEERISGVLMILFCVLFAIGCVIYGGASEIIDEKGIRISCGICSIQYKWSEIWSVGVVVEQGKWNSRTPYLQIQMRGGTQIRPSKQLPRCFRRTKLVLRYTRSALRCIRFYFGDLTFDDWGKPPTLT